jgi:cytosol alanyl aminopeptidase
VKTPGLVCAALSIAWLGCGAPAAVVVAGGGRAPRAAPVDAPPRLRLPLHVQPAAYRATIRVDPAEPGFRGRVEIDARVVSPSKVIWLHARGLVVDRATATAGGRTVGLTTTRRRDDFIGLHAPGPLAGPVTLALSYHGAQEEKGAAGLFRQRDGERWYSYTQFEPIFARRVFPSFDEPDRKTPWTLTLEVPAGLTALANTRPVGEEVTRDGWKRVTFAPTRPLPAYLVAFAVGPFEIADASRSRSGVPIRIVALAGKLDRAAVAADVLPRALALLEDYLDAPYPYDKLDLVPIPVTVGYSCMEHPGLVTCAESSMLFDPARPIPDDRRLIAGLAAHELAHQWFGNLVTPAWWDDLWLNEGLANWIEDRIASAIEPRPDDGLATADHHASALAADRLTTARAVREPIRTPDDIHGAFDGVTYDKAAAVIAMFEQWIGPDSFQRGLRAYVKKHADGVATSVDFLRAIGGASPRDVTGLATFLDQPGAPRLRTALKCMTRPGSAAVRPILVVDQSRRRAARAGRAGLRRRWRIPFCFAYDRDGRRDEKCIELRKDYALILLDAKTCPRWMVPNAGGFGHYWLTRTREMVEQAIATGWPHMTPVERVVLAQEVRGMLGDGQLDVTVAMGLVPRLLAEDNRAAIEWAVKLASVRSAVPAARMAAYDRWLRKTFGDAARRLGWVRRPGEPADFEQRRQALVGLVAFAGDPVLQDEARRLAADWRALPREGRYRVLGGAVRADLTGAIFDRLLADVRREKDRETRAELYVALTATRDPDRVARALALLLDETVDIREVAGLPDGFWGEPVRRQVEAFVRQHLDALFARYPHDAMVGSGSPFIGVFTGACDAARRHEIATFVREKFAGLPGGPRDVAQNIEAMDNCIKWKARLGPRLDSWLARE